MTKKSKKWTLNADVGEGCDDQLIMPYLDCANIACGEHAGDEAVMQTTLQLAKKYNVVVGAHPGYPDKANFGRHHLDLTTDELTATLTVQIKRLLRLADAEGLTPRYVKPHGALNHDMLQKPEILTTICNVVAAIDNNLAIMIPTNANHVAQTEMATQRGLTIWWEVFADRAYEPSGLLRPRKFDDAVHTDPQMIIEQLNHIRQRGEIITIDGSVLDVSQACTICVHGDHAPSISAIQTWSQRG